VLRLLKVRLLPLTVSLLVVIQLCPTNPVKGNYNNEIGLFGNNVICIKWRVIVNRAGGSSSQQWLETVLHQQSFIIRSVWVKRGVLG
jgi:hypothetical protein